MGHSTDARWIMHRAGFDKKQILMATIWAAKWRKCPKCEAPSGKPCENLIERRRGNVVPTAGPHESRIDWEMLVANLTARGYS